MTAPARLRQADLERALKAAKRAGWMGRVEIEPSGKIVIIGECSAPGQAGRNEWDEVFDETPDAS